MAMTAPPISRRHLMAAAGALGAQLTVFGTSARAAEARPRLVVLILRGAADGLSLTPPLGDPDYPHLRRDLAILEAALPLDRDFGLHPELSAVQRLARAGQARFAPAVAMPDPVRSHFEAQDRLEAGAARNVSSGWLNRALAALSEGRPSEALSIGPVAPLILRGAAPASAWSPGQAIDPEGRAPALLAALYADDPLLSEALRLGLRTEGLAQTSLAALTDDTERPAGPRSLVGDQPAAGRRLGQAAAGFIKGEAGADLVAISLDGFDTHANQAAPLARRLAYLDALIDGLHVGLGPAWNHTVVLAVTEFGRTARVNGTAGTDHGTASTALVLGGGLKPGGLIGDWPGLQEPRLYEGRDLAPTLDLRSLFKTVLADHMGLDRRALETAVFPDSQIARPVAGLI